MQLGCGNLSVLKLFSTKTLNLNRNANTYRRLFLPHFNVLPLGLGEVIPNLLVAGSSENSFDLTDCRWHGCRMSHTKTQQILYCTPCFKLSTKFVLIDVFPFSTFFVCFFVQEICKCKSIYTFFFCFIKKSFSNNEIVKIVRIRFVFFFSKKQFIERKV